MAVKQRILEVIGPKVSRAATIARVERLTEHFYLIDLMADGLPPMGPADKIQLDTGGWHVRTYTPVVAGDVAGGMRLAIFAHGQSPGATWASNAKQGDATHFVGPRATVRGLDAPLTLVGDETSFATAANLRAQAGIQFVFEVTDPPESEQMLAGLQITGAQVIAKRSDGSHLAHLEKACGLGADPGRKLFLTGNAQTIQSLLRAAKKQGVGRAQTMVKPYWAANKVGLD